jgi:hypothetical protein
MDAILVCNLHAIQNKYLFVRKKIFSPVFVIFVSKILVNLHPTCPPLLIPLPALPFSSPYPTLLLIPLNALLLIPLPALLLIPLPSPTSSHPPTVPVLPLLIP